ncbi:MAG: helix-turn-helix domain-containing protein, partial [Deltaproteobacteria bacterium]|nr:helix-turn-helix domain-containing protein [Deltaproteobacteria bacterium]
MSKPTVFEKLHAICADDTINPADKILFIQVVLRTGNGENCYPGISTLKKWTALSADQIKRSSKRLQGKGKIHVQRRFLRSNVYTPLIGSENKPCRGQERPKQAQPPIPAPKPPKQVKPRLQSEQKSAHSERKTAPIVSAPVRYIKEQRQKENLKKQTNTAHPESKPTPPTSEQRPSVSLEPMIKNFEDIVKWADNTCMACGSKTKLVESLIDGRGKKTDLTNVQACCEKCTGDASNTFQEGMRTDYRARFAQSHG